MGTGGKRAVFLAEFPTLRGNCGKHAVRFPRFHGAAVSIAYGPKSYFLQDGAKNLGPYFLTTSFSQTAQDIFLHFECDLSVLRRSPDEFANEMRLAAAIHWYKRGEISQGKAAKIWTGSHDFLLALAREGEDAFVVDFADLERELQRG